MLNCHVCRAGDVDLKFQAMKSKSPALNALRCWATTLQADFGFSLQIYGDMISLSIVYIYINKYTHIIYIYILYAHVFFVPLRCLSILVSKRSFNPIPALEGAAPAEFQHISGCKSHETNVGYIWLPSGYLT